MSLEKVFPISVIFYFYFYFYLFLFYLFLFLFLFIFILFLFFYLFILANYFKDFPKKLKILSLDNLRHLKVVDLRVALKDLSLETLSLSGCSQIDNEVIEILPVTLTSLNLSNTNIEDSCSSYLSTNIVSLNVSNCLKLTEKFISGLKEISTKQLDNKKKHFLTSLNISGLSKLTPNSFLNFPFTLKELQFDNNNIMEDKFIEKMDYMISLESFSLGNNSKLSDFSLDKKFPTLLHLNLESCLRLSNDTLQCLPASLTSLNLSGNLKVTDSVVSSFSKNLTRLSYLNLSYCSGLTDSFVPSLPPSIISLDVSHCPKFVVNNDFFVKILPPNLLYFGCKPNKIDSLFLKKFSINKNRSIIFI